MACSRKYLMILAYVVVGNKLDRRFNLLFLNRPIIFSFILAHNNFIAEYFVKLAINLL